MLDLFSLSMDKVSKIIIAIVLGVIVVLFVFLKFNHNQILTGDSASKVGEMNSLVYVDSISGLTFEYNKDWTVEKHKKESGAWYITANAPFEKEYLKFVRIYISPIQDLEAAVKDWWVSNFEILNFEENNIYFQHPKTHRYQGITYAANRAEMKEVRDGGTYAIEYRVMAVHKSGKTILLVEQAERGGLDGFEADGFIRIEKTINIIEK